MKATISNHDGSPISLFVLFVTAEHFGLLRVFHTIATIFSQHNFTQYARCCMVRRGKGTHRSNVLGASIPLHIDERQIYRAEREMNRLLSELLPGKHFSFTLTKHDSPTGTSFTLQINYR